MTIKLLKIVFFLYLAFFNTASYAVGNVESSLWLTFKSAHFIIYYEDAPEVYISELADKAEKYYNEIVENLGYRRFDFWNWDKRAKIYLYRDTSGYYADTQHRGSGAMVEVSQRTIKTFIGQKDFFESILPHELTHIIFREFVGSNIKLPLWLDEGVACSEEKTTLAGRLEFAKELVAQNRYLGIAKFSIIGDNTPMLVPQNFYAQAASLVVFLSQRYGRDKFFEFSCELRDEQPWKEALMKVYKFGDFKDMEDKWKEFVLK